MTPYSCSYHGRHDVVLNRISWRRQAVLAGTNVNEGDGRVDERDEASLADFPG